jgi:uncharacterized protein YqjF (DUF2071 family)
MPLRRDVSDARRQPRTLALRDHRPWPLPDRPWLQGQTWHHLLFAHWPVDPEALRPLVHPAIPIDLWQGRAWIGVTPFEVGGAHPRRLPPLPPVASFPELNVRTYATIDGKPGIWFFSLDTSNRPAVETARRVYRLPYFPSRASIRRRGNGRIRFQSERTQRDAPAASIDVEYEPTGAARAAEPGSFEEFATERYCLYTLDDRERVLRGDIHHRPWPLQPAEARFKDNDMGAEVALDLDDDPILHFARRQDVVFWLNEPA